MRLIETCSSNGHVGMDAHSPYNQVQRLSVFLPSRVSTVSSVLVDIAKHKDKCRSSLVASGGLVCESSSTMSMKSPTVSMLWFKDCICGLRKRRHRGIGCIVVTCCKRGWTRLHQKEHLVHADRKEGDAEYSSQRTRFPINVLRSMAMDCSRIDSLGTHW